MDRAYIEGVQRRVCFALMKHCKNDKFRELMKFDKIFENIRLRIQTVFPM